MKTIPTFVHGVGDYLGGIVLLLAPNIFGFADVGGAAVMMPRIIGLIVLLQAMTTRYELGLVKALPMKMHLMNDYVAALVLAASPWLFGFNHEKSNAWMPHLIVGIAILVFAAMTQTEPSRRGIGQAARAR
jgi:hypothetical protein